jgi:methionine-S-sulfoxide reductase
MYNKPILLLINLFIFIGVFSQNINMNTELATFGGGCFWCTEAIFQELEGVVSVQAGYAGGETKNPSYEDICTGTTGHAEVIQITYNPKKINYELLLDVFFSTHDPTTVNRQGADRGTQYRSVIFYHNDNQKLAAISIVKELKDKSVFASKIVTDIVPYEVYYKAENYHQNYYTNNPTNGYCNVVINPKLTKFMKAYKDKLKK